MARTLIKDTSPLAAEILDGKHDAILDYLDQAIRARKKTMFRKGTRVRLTGTRNPELEGREGVVTAVNAKRISVGVGEKDEYGFYEDSFLVPVAMLEVIA